MMMLLLEFKRSLPYLDPSCLPLSFFFFFISTVPLQVALDLNKQHCHSTAYTVQQIIII